MSKETAELRTRLLKFVVGPGLLSSASWCVAEYLLPRPTNWDLPLYILAILSGAVAFLSFLLWLAKAGATMLGSQPRQSEGGQTGGNHIEPQELAQVSRPQELPGPLLSTFSDSGIYLLPDLTSTNIVVELKIQEGTIMGGSFQQNQRKFECRRIGTEGDFRDILIWFGFEHSRRNTSGWCPTLLESSERGLTLDIPAAALLTKNPYRCWFNLGEMVLWYQVISESEVKPKRRASRLIRTIELGRCKGQGLFAELWDGDRVEVSYRLADQPLTVSSRDEWEPEGTPFLKRSANAWLYHLKEIGPASFVQTADGAKEKYVATIGKTSNSPGIKEPSWQLRLEPGTGTLQIVHSGLGQAALFRSDDFEITCRFRERGLSSIETQFLCRERVLSLDLDQKTLWWSDQPGSRALFALARAGQTLKLERLSDDTYLAEVGSHSEYWGGEVTGNLSFHLVLSKWLAQPNYTLEVS